MTAGRCCGAVAALGAASVVLAPAVWAAWAGMAVMGLGYALVMPLAFARAAADDRRPPGAAIAAVSLFAYGGMLSGPPLIGFLAHAAGLRPALALLIVLAAVIVVASPGLRHPGARPPHDRARNADLRPRA